MAARERVIADGGQLVECGSGVRFAVDGDQGAIQAFAIRYRGRVHAYLNRCPHQGTELDWLPGAFFDASGGHLVCATHGALFVPDTGSCIDGPCRGARLPRVRVRVRSADGAIVLDEPRARIRRVERAESTAKSRQEDHG